MIPMSTEMLTYQHLNAIKFKCFMRRAKYLTFRLLARRKLTKCELSVLNSLLFNSTEEFFMGLFCLSVCLSRLLAEIVLTSVSGVTNYTFRLIL
jgi:hypothetical protein